jgi:peptidyl-tRNA hydrolase
MKMYIAVLDEVPDHMVPVLVAHAVLGAHLHFNKDLYDDTLYNVWLNTSFKKVVLKVNRKEFWKIAELDDIYLAYEKHTLHGIDSCIVVCPREDNPKVLTFAKMWKPIVPS